MLTSLQLKNIFAWWWKLIVFFWNNRSLAYCGKQCFEKHAKERYARLLVQMISFESLSENTIDFDDFNFDNESFFVSLGWETLWFIYLESLSFKETTRCAIIHQILGCWYESKANIRFEQLEVLIHYECS